MLHLLQKYTNQLVIMACPWLYTSLIRLTPMIVNRTPMNLFIKDYLEATLNSRRVVFIF